MYSCSSSSSWQYKRLTDQVEAELQVEASSLREELGERKYQVVQRYKPIDENVRWWENETNIPGASWGNKLKMKIPLTDISLIGNQAC